MACQDISCAGKGEGIKEGNRSGLFFEIMRLADVVKPKFLFLENVPAIRTRGLGIVLQELAERRYDCRWAMLSAAQVGAPHKRKRWFLLANSQESDGGGELRGLSGESPQIRRPENQYQNEAKQLGDTSPNARILADADKGRLSQTRPEQQTTGFAGDCSYVADAASEIGSRLSCGKEKAYAISGIPSFDGRREANVADAKQQGLERRETETEPRRREYQSEGCGVWHGSDTGSQSAGNLADAESAGAGLDERWLWEGSESGDHGERGTREGEDARTAKSGLGLLVDGSSAALDKGLPEYLSPTWWEKEPEGVPRTTLEKEQRVERIKRLGNGVVPLQARVAFFKLWNGEF